MQLLDHGAAAIEFALRYSAQQAVNVGFIPFAFG